jgi:hypothetical protein
LGCRYFGAALALATFAAFAPLAAALTFSPFAARFVFALAIFCRQTMFKHQLACRHLLAARPPRGLAPDFFTTVTISECFAALEKQLVARLSRIRPPPFSGLTLREAVTCTEVDFAPIHDPPLYVATKLARSPQFGEDSNSGWSCWTLSATLRKACAHAEKPVGGKTGADTGELLGMGTSSFGAEPGVLVSERAELSFESCVRALTGAEYVLPALNLSARS